MKKIVSIIALSLATLASFAQYPLPSTQVYGDLIVDSSFVNEFQGYTLMNDTVTFGPFSIPLVGSGGPFANGVWFDGTGNFSGIGQSSRQATIGYLSAGNNTNIRIDTSNVVISAYRDAYMYAQTPSSTYQQGFTAFSDQSTVAHNTTQYTLLRSLNLDVNVIGTDSVSTWANNIYSIADANNYAVNSFKMDSTAIQLNYGSNVNSPISSRDSVFVKIDPLGLSINTTTAAFLPPRMTATQASALTPADGAMLYTTDTNGTFTQIGLWAYINGSWTALH
jgi:hypothetical protein